MPPTDTRAGDSRRDPVVLIALAVALLLLRVGVTMWEEQHPGAPVDMVRWVPLAQAGDVARVTGKPILYDFSAAWCGPCQSMEREVFSDERHARRLGELAVPVHVVDRAREDGHNAPGVDSLQHAFAVDAFPTLVVYSPQNGRHENLSGYGGVEPTMEWLASKVMEVRMRSLVPAPATTPQVQGVPIGPGH